jgi:ATP-dependent Clp protease adaptor protein ClpS
MSVDTDVVLDEKIKVRIDEPKMHKVIFLNDDTTPMEFVVNILTNIFKHTEETATEIMLKIHNEGSGIVGVFTYEIAEQKAHETVNLARENGFGLRVKLESM